MSFFEEMKKVYIKIAKKKKELFVRQNNIMVKTIDSGARWLDL